MRVIPTLFVWASVFDLSYKFMTNTGLALHPGIKLAYCQAQWDAGYYDAGYAAFKNVVCLLLFLFECFVYL